MHALAATQAPNSNPPSLGASHNMRMQVPGAMEAALDVQIATDYATIVERYCNDRGLGVPLQPARVEIYRQMNLLITKLSASYEALSQLNTDDNLLPLQRYVADFMAELRGDAEMEDTPRPSGLPPLALNADDTARDYLCRAFTPFATIIASTQSWNPRVLGAAELKCLTEVDMTQLTNHWFQQTKTFHRNFRDMLSQVPAATLKYQNDALATIGSQFGFIQSELLGIVEDARQHGVYTETFKTKRFEVEKQIDSVIKKVKSAVALGKPLKIKNPQISPLTAR
jgi:hypothetical protein